jgi:hypothetical protein
MQRYPEFYSDFRSKGTQKKDDPGKPFNKKHFKTPEKQGFGLTFFRCTFSEIFLLTRDYHKVLNYFKSTLTY